MRTGQDRMSQAAWHGTQASLLPPPTATYPRHVTEIMAYADMSAMFSSCTDWTAWTKCESFQTIQITDRWVVVHCRQTSFCFWQAMQTMLTKCKGILYATHHTPHTTHHTPHTTHTHTADSPKPYLLRHYTKHQSRTR